MKLPALLVLLVLLAGCIAPDDARLAKTLQLRQGMTPGEVEKLLGRPRATESLMVGTNTKTPWRGLVWKYPGLHVIFQDPESPLLNSWITR